MPKTAAAAFIDSASKVTFKQGMVSSNPAESGAGFEVDGGTLTLTNVASSWNKAAGEGGGIFVIDGTLTATDVTAGEDDAPSGAGIYLSTDSSGSKGTVLNSIVYGAATGEGILVDSSGTYSGMYSDVYGNTGGEYSGTTDPTGSSGNISSDPSFTSVTGDGHWTNDIWTLSSGSPCIDAGHPAATYDDADGTTNDMGACGGPFSGW